ncbi:Bacterial leucyl aminopeptidase precursor [Planctomycetes bacterium Poly30]|uniref:Bacterial leucyl aminopeptidase n=1 Tax=Saltatorellus ferox TaxID=2528018 RepID=A0A518EN78_9BACT|nr:Bacterial leucyl aminopeptidase precursor [Planctomycetes bacterium Poly30]
MLLSLPLLVAATVLPLQEAAGTSPEIRAEDIARRIQTLSSDAFGGRGPGSQGETTTIDYLIEQFQAMGLEPGGEGGGWTQPVPMVELTPEASPKSRFVGPGGEATELMHGRDVVLWSEQLGGEISVADSEVIFAGYGIVAPEFEWNDYAGLDVKGKTVLVMVNDPGFATQDPALFRGNAMTYYGRWTYKFEEAERQGAAACLIIHDEAAAGYGWTVVDQSWSRPQLQLGGDVKERSLRVDGWISGDAATSLVAAAGQDLAALAAAASTREAKSGPLPGVTFFTSFGNRMQRVTSANVVAQRKGRTKPDEYVLVCAHWDHLGTREGSEDEDNIYNGAVDNASGSASLLELAEAIAAQETAPARSILFLVTTAEEKGLLGSKYYAENPIVPLAKTVCGLNIDVANTLGPMKDIVVVGYGASELDQDLAAMALAQGRTIVPEASPEKGYYFRSDHFSLAKVGVPMMYMGEGTVSVEHGEEWVTRKKAEFTRRHYHKLSDEYDPSWDLGGAVEDVQLFHGLVNLWANEPRGREWSADSEFRAAREKSLRGR